MKNLSTEKPISGEVAMRLLAEGNGRFASNGCVRPHSDSARRKEVLEGQHPFAAVLTCADSRVPPEIIFDAGIGDLFVVRNAGNLADTEAAGSIEYAVTHLGVRLVVVLGHTRCGAVAAAMKGEEAEGCLGQCIMEVSTAVAGAKDADSASERNARFQMKRLLLESDILSTYIKEDGLKVAAGIYDLENGKVAFLPR